MTKWLSEVVARGTGKKAKLEHFIAAGKTGTAQMPASGGGYQPGIRFVLFAFICNLANRYLATSCDPITSARK